MFATAQVSNIRRIMPKRVLSLRYISATKQGNTAICVGVEAVANRLLYNTL